MSVWSDSKLRWVMLMFAKPFACSCPGRPAVEITRFVNVDETSGEPKFDRETRWIRHYFPLVHLLGLIRICPPGALGQFFQRESLGGMLSGKRKNPLNDPFHFTRIFVTVSIQRRQQHRTSHEHYNIFFRCFDWVPLVSLTSDYWKRVLSGAFPPTSGTYQSPGLCRWTPPAAMSKSRGTCSVAQEACIIPLPEAELFSTDVPVFFWVLNSTGCGWITPIVAYLG